jgi:hypothetical protein
MQQKEEEEDQGIQAVITTIELAQYDIDSIHYTLEARLLTWRCSPPIDWSLFNYWKNFSRRGKLI